MSRRMIPLAVLVALAGCGDPLAGIDRISDVELAPASTPTPQIAPTVEPAETGGFLGLFRRTRQNVAIAAAEVGSVENTTLAALPVEPEPTEEITLFGRSKPYEDGVQDVAFGTVLPFGAVGRVCDVRTRDLGSKVEKGPVRGVAIYDSAPGTTGARTHYVTGFSDGCVRQLTAAHVVIGGPAMYDLLHYGPAAQDLPVGATDRAYEKVKRQVCGVSAKKPCGGRIKRLERGTYFVNAYDAFGNVSSWSEMLVHEGAVIATALKSNG